MFPPGRSLGSRRAWGPDRSRRSRSGYRTSRRRTPSAALACHPHPRCVRADRGRTPLHPTGPVPDGGTVPATGRPQGRAGRCCLRRSSTSSSRPWVDRQHVAGVVTDCEVWAKADAALVSRVRLLLVRAREHDRGIQINDGDARQFTDRRPSTRGTRPGVRPALPTSAGGTRRRCVHPGHLQLPDLVQGPPHRRSRGTAPITGRRCANAWKSPIASPPRSARGPGPPGPDRGHRPARSPAAASPLTAPPADRSARPATATAPPRVSYQTLVIPDQLQTISPRSTLHGRGAPALVSPAVIDKSHSGWSGALRPAFGPDSRPCVVTR